MRIKELDKVGFLAKATMLYYSIQFTESPNKFYLVLWNKNIENPQRLNLLVSNYRNWQNFRDLTIINEVLTKYNKNTQSKVDLL